MKQTGTCPILEICRTFSKADIWEIELDELSNDCIGNAMCDHIVTRARAQRSLQNRTSDTVLHIMV